MERHEAALERLEKQIDAMRVTERLQRRKKKKKKQTNTRKDMYIPLDAIDEERKEEFDFDI